MFETPTARTVTAISSILCILTSTVTLATFLTFPWFRSHPRQLYLHFTLADLLSALLALPVLIMGDNQDSATYVLAVLAYAATLSTYAWQLCLAHAVYLQLAAMNMTLTGDLNSAEQLMARREAIKRWKRRYIIGGWALPCACALLTFVGVSFSSLPFARMTSHSDIPKKWFFNIPDIAIYILTCVAAGANVRTGKRAMQSLGVGTSEASIHENSVSFAQTYLGMFVLFGVLRFPSVIMSAVQLFEEGSSLIDSDNSTFAGFAAFNAQFSGVPLFFWFAYKFDFIGLWKRWWVETNRGASDYLLGEREESRGGSGSGSGKVTETLAGVF